MQRFLALDIGQKRTGIALVDDSARVATPLEIIAHETDSIAFIDRLLFLITEWEPTALLVGLPIDLKGKEAIAANDVRKRATVLLSKVNSSRKKSNLEPLEIHFVDERLTTAQAERSMRDANMSAAERKNLRDALAAAVIAQTFIDTL